MGLAEQPLVALRMSAHEGRSRAKHRRRSAGFSLMELMVVIVLIALLAILAIPTMGDARFDRRAYDDAGQILELARMARTRAVGRGGAVLLEIDANASGNTDRGTIRVWDAVRPNADIAIDGGVGGDNRTPVQSCKAPTTWTLDTSNPANGNAAVVETFSMNTVLDQQGSVQAQIIDPNGGSTQTSVFICFTPLGRTYYAAGTPNFDSAPIFNGGLEVLVYRQDSSVAARTPTGTSLNLNYRGPLRAIVIPSSGMPRLVSQ